MSAKKIPLKYANSLMYELEKAFWDERGRGARFRMTTVGREFFNDRVAPLLDVAEIGAIVQKVQEVLQEEGIAGSVAYEQEDRLLRVRVKGCLHRQVEDRLNERGIEPCACIPANLIALAIEAKLDRPVELAEVKLLEGACQLLLVVFDRRPTLG